MTQKITLMNQTTIEILSLGSHVIEIKDKNGNWKPIFSSIFKDIAFWYLCEVIGDDVEARLFMPEGK